MRTLILIAVVAFVALLQWQLSWLAGFRPDLLLASLITLALFVGPAELILVLLAAALGLNWQPGLNYELILYLALPVLVFFLRGSLPWQSWFNNLVVVAAAILLFYLALHGTWLWNAFRPGFLAAFAGSLLWSAALFRLLHGFLKFPLESPFGFRT